MVLLLSWMAFARRRDHWFRYYLCFVTAFFLLMLFQTIRFFYDLAAQPEAALMSRIFTGLFLLVLDFMVYLVPFFSTWLAGVRWRGPIAAVFTSLAAAYFLLALLFTVFLSESGLLYALLVLIFLSMVVYAVIILLARRNRIERERMRTLSLSFAVLSAVFCPLIVADALLSWPKAGLGSGFISGGIAFPAYFLWFSVIALVYLVGYFVHLPEAEAVGFSRQRLDELKITGREREIISLLARGLTSKEIGGQLGISVHTVNNHLANIYAKAGAGNRIELLRALS